MARRRWSFDGQDAAVVALDDQIDLVVPVTGAQVARRRLARLGEDAQVQGDERFEERAEERAVPRERSR